MSHERTPVTFVSIDELDLDALSGYVSRRIAAVDDEPSAVFKAAQRLGLTARSGPNYAPTVAGLLLFGREPQLMHPQWGLVAARFDGHSVTDPVVAKLDASGRLSAMMDAATAFVRDHTQTLHGQVSDGPVQVEYAEVALREVIANALVHRDLRATGRVAIRIFDDRLEVWSPGGAVHPSVGVDALPESGGVSLPRNPLLAAHARELGLGEQLGRGLATARRASERTAHQPMRVAADNHSWQVTVPSGLSAAFAAH